MRRSGRDPKRLYRIASITKTFTATAIMQLRDEGKLSLDDPAVEYLPELEEAQSTFGPIETMTIRRMLSHESGLQSEPPGTDWTASGTRATRRATLARAKDIATTVPPNSSGSTRTSRYQLLGEIVARVSRDAVQEVVRDADPDAARR